MGVLLLLRVVALALLPPGAGLPAHAAAPAATPGPEEARLLAEMAVEGTNSARLFALADLLHDHGVDGDKEAPPRAEAYLRQLLATDPTNAPALALLGSVYTLKGRDAFWPTTQLRLVREGNQFMDQAVQLAPENLRARTIRALNNAHMPEFLGRTEIVRADLAWLWDRLRETPDRFTVSQRQNLAYHWGRQLKRMHRPDDARQVWEEGLRVATDTQAAAKITAELQTLR